MRALLGNRRFGVFSKMYGKYKEMFSDKDLVGEDVYGNKFYQRYDSDGYPIKREVLYKNGIHDAILDPVWSGWLTGTKKIPPTKEECKNSFDGYIKRKTIGEEYEKKDEKMMKDFRETLKKVTPPKKKDYEPELWKPEGNSNKKY